MGKLRCILQSVPITLLCYRVKQRNRMFAGSSTKVGSTSKEMVSLWCALPEPLPCESLAWKYLDTDRIVKSTLYLITEMLLHNNKLALISMGLQAGGSGRVHSERSSLLLRRKQCHILCICELGYQASEMNAVKENWELFFMCECGFFFFWKSLASWILSLLCCSWCYLTPTGVWRGRNFDSYFLRQWCGIMFSGNATQFQMWLLS